MKSVKGNIMMMIVSIVLISLLTTFIYFVTNTRKSVLENADNSVNFFIQNIEDEVYLVMNNLESVSMKILTNKEIKTHLENFDDFENLLQAKYQIESIMKYNYAWDYKYINGVFIYKEQDRFIADFRNATIGTSIMRTNQIYKDYYEHKSLHKLVKPAYIEEYAYYIQDISSNTLKKLGKLIIEVDPSKFLNLEGLQNVYSAAYVSIEDSQGNIIYRTPQKNVVYNSYSHKMDKYDVVINVFIPKADIYGSYYQSMFMFFVTSVGMTIFMALFLRVFYNRIINPFDSMILSMNKVKEGDFTVRIDPTSYKEFNEIIYTFNDMADNMGDLFSEVYEQGKELSRAELIMLQSQINPHFIFNVLEVINLKAQEIQNEDISQMIQNLAKLMRSNILLSGKDKITLNQEIDYAKYYLEIQKTRFNFDYTVTYEDDLINMQVPKLIIQPLVENCVVHGFLNKSNGIITISVWTEDNFIFYKITDNGVGFKTSVDKNETETHNNIAMGNIKKRLEIMYGEDFEFIVKSQENKGTIVIVAFKAEEGEQIC